MAKISNLPALAEHEIDGQELTPVVRDGLTYMAPLEYLGAAAARAAALMRDQAADLVLPANIFVDVPLETAEAAVLEGVTFKRVDSASGTATVYIRTDGGSDELYSEITKTGLGSNAPGMGASQLGLEGGGTVEDAINLTSEALGTARNSNSAIRTRGFDSNLRSGSAAPWIQTGVINPEKAGVVLPGGDDFFVYDAEGRQHRYGELAFDAARFDIGSHKTGAENWDRMRDLAQYVGENVSDADRKTVIVIPNVGAPIDFAGTIEPWPGSRLEIQGHVRFTGGNGLGGFVGARPRAGAGERAGGIEICGGGVIDANMQGNDNALFVSNRDAGIADATTDIWLHHLRIRNARHGGGGDLGTVGNQGGKGITGQFGIDRLLMHDLYIDDCDIGMSLEAKSDGHLSRVRGERIFVNGSRYMGLLLGGSIGTADFRDRMDVVLDMHFRNCCNGASADADHLGDLAEYMGVITCKNVFAFLDLKAKIRATSGRTTVLYGGYRHSRFDLDSWAWGYQDIIQPQAPTVHAASAGLSLYNQYKVKAANQDGNCAGHVWADAAKQIDKSSFDIEVYDFNASGPATEWPENKFVEDMNSKVRGTIWEPQFDNLATYDHGRKLGENTLMASDTAISIPLRNESGTFFCKLMAGTVFYGITVSYDKNGALTPKVLLASARKLSGDPAVNEDAFGDIETSTSVLTGTTGTDNRITISVNGDRAYLENRLVAPFDGQIEELR